MKAKFRPKEGRARLDTGAINNEAIILANAEKRIQNAICDMRKHPKFKKSILRIHKDPLTKEYFQLKKQLNSMFLTAKREGNLTEYLNDKSKNKTISRIQELSKKLREKYTDFELTLAGDF